MDSLRKPQVRRDVRVNLAAVGLPEIPLVGMQHLPSARSGLLEHVHAETMEICYLKRGQRTYHVADRDYVMKGNDVFVTFPDEQHGSGSNPSGKGVLYWLQATFPKRPQGFLSLQAREAWGLVQKLQHLPSRHFRGDRRLPRLFERIVSLTEEGTGELRRLTIATAVTELLLLVISCAEAADKRVLTEDIERSVELIENYPERNVSIRALASAAGLSESRFKAKFREQLGIPPGEYVLRCKVELAREMLAAGQRSVTAIAFELGFSSSQYFATVFKRFTNTRPSDVRDGHRS